MSVAPAIITRLLTISAITGIVETRIARDRPLSSWASEQPYIVIHNEDEDLEYCGSGTILPIESRLTIDVFTKSSVQADTIQEAIRDCEGAFNTNSWTANGVQVDTVFYESGNYMNSPEVAGDSYGSHNRAIFCRVHWRPAPE